MGSDIVQQWERNVAEIKVDARRMEARSTGFCLRAASRVTAHHPAKRIQMKSSHSKQKEITDGDDLRHYVLSSHYAFLYFI